MSYGRNLGSFLLINSHVIKPMMLLEKTHFEPFCGWHGPY